MHLQACKVFCGICDYVTQKRYLTWNCHLAVITIRSSLYVTKEEGCEMLSRQSRLQEDTYFKIMHHLSEDSVRSQRELAGALGISLGAVNYSLKAMQGKGWVQLTYEVVGSEKKSRQMYRLTAEGVSKKISLARSYLQRKLQEYDGLAEEISKLKRELEAT